MTEYEKRGRFSFPFVKFVSLPICGFSQPLCDGMRKCFAFSVPFVLFVGLLFVAFR